MFGPTLPPNDPTWQSGTPCANCDTLTRENEQLRYLVREIAPLAKANFGLMRRIAAVLKKEDH